MTDVTDAEIAAIRDRCEWNARNGDIFEDYVAACIMLDDRDRRLRAAEAALVGALASLRAADDPPDDQFAAEWIGKCVGDARGEIEYALLAPRPATLPATSGPAVVPGLGAGGDE